MKLKSWIENLFKPQFYLRPSLHFLSGNYGQNVPVDLNSFESYMSLLSLSARRAVVCFCVGLFIAIPAVVFGQTNYYAAYGTEYAIAGSLPGDQMFPDIALNTSGGYVVWQDNITDGSGWGVSAMQVDSTLSGSGSTFRVNVTGTNDQEHARVALLKNGGAAFVWQGGVRGVNQHIYARFLSSSNLWLNSTDVLVSTYTAGDQCNPSIAALTNGNVIVVWSSYNQVNSTSLMDVYGQVLSTNGTPIGTNFLINQFTQYNQRNPAVAALTNGCFVVTWVSEQEGVVAVTNTVNYVNNSSNYTTLTFPSVDIYARLYTNYFKAGTNYAVAAGNEFKVDTGTFPCSSPAVAAAADGTYMITWCAKNLTDLSSSWDIYERSFTGNAGGSVYLVNTYTYGDQYNPRICVIGKNYLIVWTSLGQDGSREGVYGQFVNEGDVLVGGEFQVNTTTLGQQMEPSVASDGAEQFLAVWTSYTFSPNGFDLYAQRFENTEAVLDAMPAPFVWAPFVVSNGVYQPQLVVSWPPVQGLAVSNYLIFVDGAAANMATVSGSQGTWTMTTNNGLTASSTHSFALEYVTSLGFPSPISPSTSASTWLGYYWGNPPWEIPVEWMSYYYGADQSSWPQANAPLATGGPSLWQVFESGGNPTNSATWLAPKMTWTSQGTFLSWNTQPGMTYQVQEATSMVPFSGWVNFEAPRFAQGTSDSINVSTNNMAKSPTGYFRIQLLRQ
jgi:hypothetical protein